MENISSNEVWGIGDSMRKTIPNDTDITHNKNSVCITTDVLKYKDKNVRVSNDLVCLTDIWIAEGRTRNKNPGKWIRYDSSKESISRISYELGRPEIELLKVKCRGNGQGYTFVHYEIAKIYTWYLSIFSHTWILNTLIPYLDFMKEKELYQKNAERIDSRLDRIEKLLSAHDKNDNHTSGKILLDEFVNYVGSRYFR